jgi:proteic killer suppression protein
VEVRFASRQLERRYHVDGEAERAWGQQVGRRYRERINQMLAATTAEDLYRVRAAGLHPLTGDLAGFHALRLTGRMRLVVTLVDSQTLRIERVVDYHG